MKRERRQGDRETAKRDDIWGDRREKGDVIREWRCYSGETNGWGERRDIDDRGYERLSVLMRLPKKLL